MLKPKQWRLTDNFVKNTASAPAGVASNGRDKSKPLEYGRFFCCAGRSGNDQVAANFPCLRAYISVFSTRTGDILKAVAASVAALTSFTEVYPRAFKI